MAAKKIVQCVGYPYYKKGGKHAMFLNMVTKWNIPSYHQYQILT